ncbi:WXG100-like domain-containing protein [Nocardia sp. IBHARD005]|uniref:WXG100-like domain-containing protein n=1 Tax=Nocardia sp. IBHARD005 TaxID=3457765 RepID=UPI0040582923
MIWEPPLAGILGYLVGMQWPEGNEDLLWGLADDWKGAATNLKSVDSEIVAAMNAVRQAYPTGDGGDKMIAQLQSLRTGESSIFELAKWFDSVAGSADRTGTQIEYTKLMFHTTLVMLAADIAAAWLFPPTAPAAEGAILGLGRVIVRFITTGTVKQIAKEVPKLASASMLKFAVRTAAIGGGLGAVQDLGVQGYQALNGRRDGIDMKQLGLTALGGAAGGAVAGPMGIVGGRMLFKEQVEGAAQKSLTTVSKNLLIGGVSGAGAGLAGWAANAAVTGDWHFDPRVLSAGVAGGALPSGASHLPSAFGRDAPMAGNSLGNSPTKGGMNPSDPSPAGTSPDASGRQGDSVGLGDQASEGQGLSSGRAGDASQPESAPGSADHAQPGAREAAQPSVSESPVAAGPRDSAGASVPVNGAAETPSHSATNGQSAAGHPQAPGSGEVAGHSANTVGHAESPAATTPAHSAATPTQSPSAVIHSEVSNATSRTDPIAASPRGESTAAPIRADSTPQSPRTDAPSKSVRAEASAPPGRAETPNTASRPEPAAASRASQASPVLPGEVRASAAPARESGSSVAPISARSTGIEATARPLIDGREAVRAGEAVVEHAVPQSEPTDRQLPRIGARPDNSAGDAHDRTAGNNDQSTGRVEGEIRSPQDDLPPSSERDLDQGAQGPGVEQAPRQSILPEDPPLTDRERALAAEALKAAGSDDFLAQLKFNPDAVLGVESTHRRTNENHEWWRSLTPEQQNAMVRVHPHEVGNPDGGIPRHVRDEANRLSMARDLAALGDAPPERPKGLWSKMFGGPEPMSEVHRKNLEDTIAALTNVEERAALYESEFGIRPPVHVLSYDSSLFNGEGRAVVAFGDVARASSVSWHIPGITTTIRSLDTNLRNAFNHLWETSALLDVKHNPVLIASIAWIGYDAPSGFKDCSGDAKSRVGEEGRPTFSPGCRCLRAGTSTAGRRSRRGRCPKDSSIRAQLWLNDYESRRPVWSIVW